LNPAIDPAGVLSKERGRSKGLILIGLVALVAFGAIALYNSLIRKRNLVKEGWSGIDVQLKRRYDLIPNLIETVKGYGKHEKELFEKLAEARQAAITAKGVPEQGKAENALTAGIRSLFAVAENYPDLKASQNFMELQKTLAAVEDEIQMARRYYNGCVRDLNTAVQSFPAVLFAKSLGFSEAEFFEIETATEKQNPEVKF
jgi:LemA protein